MQKLSKLLLTLGISSVSILAASIQPNPPIWPYNPAVGGVKVFDNSMTAAINAFVTSAPYTNNYGADDHGQFSNYRFALLFQPGTYSGVQIPVGYYISILGLGQAPTQTIFDNTSNVYNAEGSSTYTTGALNTFWRSAENFETTPNFALTGIPNTFVAQNDTMLWAVSQASPIRRVKVNGELWLYQVTDQNPPNMDYQGGRSSGGYMADCIVTGTVTSGTQQQWLSRNCNMTWSGSLWNMVYVGCTGTIPASSTNGIAPPPVNPPFIGYSTSSAFTNVAQTPYIAEKPYIRYDGVHYFLEIPNAETNKSGPTTNYSNTTSVDFMNVYVSSYLDTAATINAQLSSGNHVILTPGIYNNLNGSIVVSQENTVILGIGFPTLIPSGGNPCIIVNDGIGGVRIGGILLQASSTNAAVLLQWGTTNNTAVARSFLYDCFARVGGPANPEIDPTSADLMVQINSANVVCDNLWLWRADHWGTPDGTSSGLTVNSQSPCNTAFQMNGDNGIAYGLACEHTLQDSMQWRGNNGQVYFYQSEYPYDVTQENFGNLGYVSYRAEPAVAGQAYTHTAYGIGVYTFFRDYTVIVNTGIATPATNATVSFTNPFTRFLTGHGGMNHVINGTGLPINVANASEDLTSYVSTYPSGSSIFNPRSRRR